MIKRNICSLISSILTVLFLLTVTTAFSQPKSSDNICNNPDTKPKYDDDIIGLFHYLTNDLAPIVANCNKSDNYLTSSMHLILTIDANGKVIDIVFQKSNLTSFCKDELKKKMITMNGWTAGQKNGKAVCSKFIWPINCLKWE